MTATTNSRKLATPQGSNLRFPAGDRSGDCMGGPAACEPVTCGSADRRSAWPTDGFILTTTVHPFKARGGSMQDVARNGLLPRSLDKCELLAREAIEPAYQPVNFDIGSVDLSLDDIPLRRGCGMRSVRVQCQHRLRKV